MLKLLTICLPLLATTQLLCQKAKPASQTNSLQFEFTRQALKLLKEIERVDGVPPGDAAESTVEEGMLDDLDTLARSSGEVNTVALLKELSAEMFVNNQKRSITYYKKLNEKLEKTHASQDSEVEVVKLEAIAETMSIPSYAALALRERSCTTSIDSMLRASRFLPQPKCKGIMQLDAE